MWRFGPAVEPANNQDKNRNIIFGDFKLLSYNSTPLVEHLSCMKFLSPTFIGNFAHFISQLLIKTLRVNIHFHPNVDPNCQYIYGFWHDKQFILIMHMRVWGDGKHAGFVSASRDGEMLATWLGRLGYKVARGSSSKKAISGLVKLVAMMREGFSVGIAADGPRGPRHEAKTGISFLAHKVGLQIIPLGAATSRSWLFKSWDKYQLPKPFSKSVIYVGEPITIADLNDVDAVNTLIAQAITYSEAKAQEILAGVPSVIADRKLAI